YGAPAILVIGMLASIWTKEPTKTAPKAAAGAGDEAAA
ncbi:S26 family signal peptidase, partial [Arthrobacter sp. MYb23]